MKEIQLTKGQVAIVDDEDYEWLSQWKWSAADNKGRGIYYAVRHQRPDGNVPMHKEVYVRHYGEIPEGFLIDHKDRITLNNDYRNLRAVTRSESQINRNLQSNNSTGVSGIHWYERDQKYEVQLSRNGKTVYVRRYADFEEAKAERDKKAIELYGKFAILNYTD